jgi:surfeit locus 1 family protein
MPRAVRAKLIFALAFGLGGLAILLGLGTWQLQRLAWKNDLIAQLEARLSVAPVPLPAAPDRARDAYLRVAVPGRYAEGELHVLTSRKPYGPGFRVIAPFETQGGRRILVDRGFVPEEEKDAARPLPQGPVTVTGALVWPRETDMFTPEPDRAENFWFARDVPLMAEALDTAPLMVAAESNPGERPVATPVTVNLRNTHLQYAITWFGLAVGWAAMTAALVLRIRRRGEI